MNKGTRNRDQGIGKRVRRLPTGQAGILSLIALGLTGCALVNNPFRDDLAHEPPPTTGSVEGVRMSGAAEQITTRGFEVSHRHPEDGAVLHWPTWFEDPYEENGSEDGKFAWTAVDYWQMVYWRGRFLVEAAIWPVSAIAEPPWAVMASDGHLHKRSCGELHDVERVHVHHHERDSATEPTSTPSDSAPAASRNTDG